MKRFDGVVRESFAEVRVDVVGSPRGLPGEELFLAVSLCDFENNGEPAKHGGAHALLTEIRGVGMREAPKGAIRVGQCLAESSTREPRNDVSSAASPRIAGSASS